MIEDQPLAVEWTEEAKPFPICPNCSTDYPDTETLCPACNLKLLVVHRCPRCSRIAALKHRRCPYCAWRFVKGEELESALEPGTGAAETVERVRGTAVQKQRQRKVLVFSVAVFVLIFAVTAWLFYYQSNRAAAPSVMGSSYVLQIVSVRHAPSEQTFSLGKLAAGAVVQITGVQLDERGSPWYQIRHNDGLGYLRVSELAPPKGAGADGGYQLLKVSLNNLTDPSEASDAARAVDLYRRSYPGDPRGSELLWLLAAKTHEMSRRNRSRETISVARKAYQELQASSGEYASRASEALQDLPEPATTTSHKSQDKPAMEVIGANAVGPAGPALPHRVMVLNQTRVLVNLPAAGQLQTGQVLAAHVVGDVLTNNEVAIPNGSTCAVKVTAIGSARAAQGWVGLQLQSVEVGNRSYPVDAMPVQVSADAQLKAGAPVLFVLRRSLVLSR
ncbi:MAG TPA: zinc ribbon domain-containing protein [Candidatus Angelobacter sp.]|nr:zinc ribbon domain-containing protein [Candidatus Angelobacter sp.]